MAGRNIVSVSWGDHLKFGDGDGQLLSLDAVARRMRAWKSELDAGQVLWRTINQAPRRTQKARDAAPPTKPFPDVTWDELQLAPQLAHDAGLEAYLYVTIFDEGWPLPRPSVRARSYHNVFHAQHRASQTEFAHNHPAFAAIDRAGRRRHWGVMSLAYPQVRDHFRTLYLSLLERGDFDGLFICLRSQSRPADHADQFGFNEPVQRAFLERCDQDIRADNFDKPQWRHLQGGYLTDFLRELKPALQARGTKLAIGAPRGDIIGPPIGNATLDWRTWVRGGLIDQLIIDQNASRCPSMWLDLWPMHRGTGYLQNYLSGDGMLPLKEHLRHTYAPVLDGSGTDLFLARQWHERNAADERVLLDADEVSGLVFGSFRHDNAHLLAREDWRD